MNTTTVSRSKNYDSFDLFKFIVSFVVLFVHTNPLGESHFHGMHPWVRIAIPIYFMISSFLFFSKYDKLAAHEKKQYLWKFIKRDLTLYLFWFIVFLPFTFVYRDYFHNGLVYFIGSILLGSSFPASWYLMALALSIFLTAKLDRGVGKVIYPVAALLMYLLSIGQHTWRCVANQLPFLTNFYDATPISFTATFFFSCIMIWIGRLFVRYRDSALTANTKILLPVFILALVVLFFEDKWLFDRGLFTMNNDGYLSSLIASALLFWLILKSNIHVPHARTLRIMSTLIYCIHGSVAEFIKVYVVKARFGSYEAPWSVFNFFATIVITLVLSKLIMKYSERLKILKNAY